MAVRPAKGKGTHTRWLFAALLLVAVLSLLATGSVETISNAFAEQRALEASRRVKVERILSELDQELAADLGAVQTLAASSNLDGPDLSAFHEEARRVLATQASWLTVTLADLQGWQLLSARQPASRPPVRIVQIASYDAVLRLGRPVIGGISDPAPVTGVRGIPVRVPVIRNGEIRFVLSAVLRPEAIAALVERTALPDGWVVTVMDRQGLVVSRSRDAAHHLGRPAGAAARAALQSDSTAR